MTKKSISFGQCALTLNRFKAAVNEGDLRASFLMTLEKMRVAQYPSIPYNLHYKFEEASWISYIEDRAYLETWQVTSEINPEERLTQHVQEKMGILIKAAEILNEEDQDLSSDQRWNLSNLLAEFHEQMAACRVIPPIKETNDQDEDFACCLARQAAIYSYKGPYYLNE